MYCPRCATHLATTTTRCSACDLDLHSIVELLSHDRQTSASHVHRHLATNPVQRWKQQRHGWGLLLILCSFLVGCLIPISLGIFSQLPWTGSLITTLAGFAGLLFVVGTMLILAAEGAILTTDHAAPEPTDDRPLTRPAAQTGRTTPLRFEDRGVSGLQHDAAASQPTHR